MSKVGKAIREHHRELIDSLGRQVAAVAEGSPTADAPALVKFLKGDLLPHARGEEQHLYPLVDDLIKQHGKATATMSVDHEFIEGYIRQIDEATHAVSGSSGAQRTEAEKRLRLLVVQLEAVLRVHLEKEERVYLPLFEKFLSDKEQQDVLDGMHAAYGS